MGVKYTHVRDREWVEPTRRTHKIACCDCGLVHTFTFRVVKGAVQFSAVRDNRATAQIRRAMRRAR